MQNMKYTELLKAVTWQTAGCYSPVTPGPSSMKAGCVLPAATHTHSLFIYIHVYIQIYTAGHIESCGTEGLPPPLGVPPSRCAGISQCEALGELPSCVIRTCELKLYLQHAAKQVRNPKT